MSERANLIVQDVINEHAGQEPSSSEAAGDERSSVSTPASPFEDEVLIGRIDSLKDIYLHNAESIHNDVNLYAGGIIAIISLIVGFLTGRSSIDQSTYVFLSLMIVFANVLGWIGFASMLARLRASLNLVSAMNELLWYLSHRRSAFFDALRPIPHGIPIERISIDKSTRWFRRLLRYGGRWVIPPFRHIWFVALILYNALLAVVTISWILGNTPMSGCAMVNQMQAVSLRVFLEAWLSRTGMCVWTGRAVGIAAYIAQVGWSYRGYGLTIDKIQRRRQETIEKVFG